MKVSPVPHEPLRFRVQSAANPKKFYLVELETHRNNGACDCHDFLYRKVQLLAHPYERGARQRCKHIIAAREYFLDRWLGLLAEEMKRKPKQPTTE